MNKLIVILWVVLATFIGSFGSLFLKKGADSMHRQLKSIFLNKYLYFGVGFFGLSSIFYIWALTHAELSLVYPITSLAYVWAVLLATKFLGEKTNFYKWIGITFIVLGVFLIVQ